jgi:SAM-dependent methyltransferase
MTKPTNKILTAKSGIKLDIGCGNHKQGEDWVGIDVRPQEGVDIVHNLEKFPWPLPDECATLAVSTEVVEHINPAGGTFLRFMDEVWRLLKADATFAISTPYAGSPFYWQDPTHVNGCTEVTWAYFDPYDQSGLYNVYRPKPWKIVHNSWATNGLMEVVLKKLNETKVKEEFRKAHSADQPKKLETQTYNLYPHNRAR